MQIFIACNTEQEKEILSGVDKKNDLTFAKDLPGENEYKNYDAFFILIKTDASFDFDLFENKPVFINEVITPLSELNYSKRFARINAWPGFLKRKIWEVVSEDVATTENILQQIGRKMIAVKDEPGMVSARVISMIINEAYFAIGEKISTKEEIDMAMKLGTNYPFGPFEWAEKIGIENIYLLLEALAKKEERYLPATELKEEFFRKKGRVNTYILNIDTTSENAIVALADEAKVIGSATNSTSKEHAAFLHVAIHKLLKENSISVSELKAIGVAGGPGSYTGIRVGLATAKGLCFALNIPLMMYNSLELMAASCIETIKDTKAFYCPVIDARRMEVFTAVYDGTLSPVILPRAIELQKDFFASLSVAEVGLLEKNQMYFFGSGAQKFKNITNDSTKNARFVDSPVTPKSLAVFGWKKFQQQAFENLTDSKPLYLKEFYTTGKLQ